MGAPWGKLISTTGSLASSIGAQNPHRYRAYRYDTELEMYYLNSRYYDPEIGRFINADAYASTGQGIIGNNMFAYSLNNPVIMSDPSGNLPFFAITAAIGAVVGAVAGGIIAAKNGGNIWAGIGIGAAAGALIGTGAGMAAGAALAGSITATAVDVAIGASTFATVASVGGTGAAVTYVANNLSQATNEIVNAVTTTSQVYPPNDGFNATPRESVLAAGSQLQRIGGLSGKFVAPINTPGCNLSLPPDKIGASIINLEVLNPIPVQAGTAMPWFGQPGGGTQFLLPLSIEELIANGSLKIFP